jgi:hypothetical protein
MPLQRRAQQDRRMKIFPLTRLLVLGFACTLSITPAAAQTSTGTMIPVADTGSMTKPAAPSAKTIASLPKSAEFTTTSAAAAHCPNSEVVWSSLGKSHSFHASGSRYFGKTRHGTYVCKDDALAAGFHQAKS